MSGWDVARKQARHQEALLEKKIESLRSTNASAGGRNGYDLEAATFASEQKLCSDIDAVFIVAVSWFGHLYLFICAYRGSRVAC